MATQIVNHPQKQSPADKNLLIFPQSSPMPWSRKPSPLLIPQGRFYLRKVKSLAACLLSAAAA